MEHAQTGATAEQQRWPAITGQGVSEKLEFVVHGKAWHRMITQIVQCFAHLGDVFLNQVFGANPRMSVKRGIAHITQIMVQALTKRPFQPLEVVLLAILFEVAETVIDQFIVIKVRRKVFLPLRVALQKIQFQRGGLPLFIIGSLRQQLAESGYPGVLDHLRPPGVNAQKSSSMKSSSSAKGSWVILPSLIRNSRRCRKAFRTNVYRSPEMKLSAGIRSARLSTSCSARR